MLQYKRCLLVLRMYLSWRRQFFICIFMYVLFLYLLWSWTQMIFLCMYSFLYRYNLFVSSAESFQSRGNKIDSLPVSNIFFLDTKTHAQRTHSNRHTFFRNTLDRKCFLLRTKIFLALYEYICVWRRWFWLRFYRFSLALLTLFFARPKENIWSSSSILTMKQKMCLYVSVGATKFAIGISGWQMAHGVRWTTVFVCLTVCVCLRMCDNF